MPAPLPTVYILDTGPLIDYLNIQHEYHFSRPWPNPRCNRVSLQTETHRHYFQQILSLSRLQGRFLTSTGVVAELQRHIIEARRIEDKARRSAFMTWCWSFLCATFRAANIDEPTTPLATLPEPAVIKLGPVDVGIIELAKSLIARRELPNILTGDRKTLGRQCISEGVSAPNVVDALKRELGI